MGLDVNPLGGEGIRRVIQTRSSKKRPRECRSFGELLASPKRCAKTVVSRSGGERRTTLPGVSTSTGLATCGRGHSVQEIRDLELVVDAVAA